MQWTEPVIRLKNPKAVSWILLQNVIIPTILAVISAMASIVMDSSIQGDLAIQGSQTQWITTNYLLGINSIVPIANYFADKYGYKKLYFTGIAIFAFGSLITALSTNFYMLAGGRLIEGMGAGVIFPVGLAIISQNFPKEKLSFAINLYMALGFGLGIAGGTLLAGYIGMYLPWRILFYLIIPNTLLAMLVIWLFQTETRPKVMGKFDYWGYLFFVLFIATIIIALGNGNLKSTDYGWRSPWIIGCFIASFLSLILFIFIEKTTLRPFVHLPLFKDPIFFVGCLTLFTLGLSIFSSPSLMTKYMEFGLHYDKFTTGYMLAAYGITFGLFSVGANFAAKHIPISIISIFGLSIIIVSYFLNNILSIQSGKIAISIILILRATGVAIALGPITAQSLKRVDPSRLSEASSLLTFFRQVGGTFGGIILGIVFIRREIFHDARYFDPVNKELPGYFYSFQKLKYHLIQNAGSTPAIAEMQANQLIVENIKTQSMIQSINDAMFFFGYVTIAVSLLLILLNLIDYYKSKKTIPLSQDEA